MPKLIIYYCDRVEIIKYASIQNNEYIPVQNA